MKSNYAETQSMLSLNDMELLLALVRGGTLAGAAERLKLDTSTVFRSIKRLEKNLNERLFERGKQGYLPTELARELAAYAERIETQLNEARERIFNKCDEPSGALRITTTETVLHGLLLPALREFGALYPAIQLELVVSNALANLSQREADVAIRATRKPPENLVGLKLGAVENAVYAHRSLLPSNKRKLNLADMDWIALDDTLPNHPSYRWWHQRFPKMRAKYQCNSVMSAAGAIVHGLGVGVAPCFLMDGNPDVEIIEGPLEELRTDLWILAHPDIRHLQRVKLLFDFLRGNVKL